MTRLENQAVGQCKGTILAGGCEHLEKLGEACVCSGTTWGE